MPLACECGFVPVRLKAVGFTAEYELVVHWRCIACGKLVYVVKSLADCCRECPDDEGGEEIAALNRNCEQRDAEDAKFLQMLGISLPDDAEA